MVFVTTVFEGVDTGPGTYARYLWKAFRDDPQIEFHLVAPRVIERHPRLYESGTGQGSLSLYRRVQDAGLAIARRLGETTIIHGNSTHSMGRMASYHGPLLVQVNDYDTAVSQSRKWGTFREQGVRRLLSAGWRHWHEGRVLRRATLAICNSEFTRTTILNAYGIPSSRLRVVYKAVETNAFVRPVSAQKPPDIDGLSGPHLLFLGADWQRKGLDLLLDAVRLIQPDYPKVQVTVVGPDPEDRALRSLIQKRGLFGHVMLVGQASRERVAQYMWHSDLLVLPSRREALGVAVLEAMAAGLPVVASSVGGIPEILRAGREGLLVPANDSKSLSSALSKMLGDDATRSAFRTAGLSRALEFSVPTMVDKIRSIYRSVALGRDQMIAVTPGPAVSTEPGCR